MIISVAPGSSQDQINHICERLKELGFGAHVSTGREQVEIGVIGEGSAIWANQSTIEAIPGVGRTIRVSTKYKLASLRFHPEPTVVRIGNVEVGGDRHVFMAGPCTVESEGQLLTAAHEVKKYGALVVRGGVWKPRSTPYSYQGMEAAGLKLLLKAREETGLPIVTEIMSDSDIPLFVEHDIDCWQVGTRNAQNFSLLKALGKSTKKPILLKRGMCNTVEEWLCAAEYILSAGNPNVILCERGIRTITEESISRNTPDFAAIAALRAFTHLPIVFDPSHSAGKRHLVAPLVKAALAVGADGCIIEVHPNPEAALCDGAQSLTPALYKDMMRRLQPHLDLWDAERAETRSDRRTITVPIQHVDRRKTVLA